MVVRVGIIGIGAIAPFYIKAIQKSLRASLVGACDINIRHLLSVSLPLKEVTRDYKKLLQSSNLDAVIINLPNDLHARVCEEALLSGKHVCCEKPLTLASSEAEHLLKVSKDTRKLIFTAFHRRYNSTFRSQLSSLNPEDEIVSASAEYLEDITEHCGLDSWYLDSDKCGGGCIVDNGPNVFDSLRAIFGELKIQNATSRKNERGMDIEAWISARTLGNVPIEIHLDWAYESGEKKTVTLKRRSGKTIHVDFLSGVTEFKGSLWHEYEGILEDFIDTIELGVPSPLDGLRSVELVEDTYRVLNSELQAMETAA